MAETPFDAAEKSLKRWSQNKSPFNPGPVTVVSEIGFDDPDSEFDARHVSDRMYDTDSIIVAKKPKRKGRKK